jgi:hypothetical protein
VWWKNTFFLFAFLLAVVAVGGAVYGESAVRDPGQVREGGLVLINAVAAVVMFVNGWISHQLSVQAYQEHFQDPEAD